MVFVGKRWQAWLSPVLLGASLAYAGGGGGGGTSDIVSTTTEAMQEDLPAGKNSESLQSYGSADKWFSNRITVTDLSMMMGPPVGDLAAQPETLPASSHGHAAPALSIPVGYSLRHVLVTNYSVAPKFSIAPVLDVSQSFYGPDSGKLIFNDPQLRLSFRDIARAHLGPHLMRVHLWVSIYAPVSDTSQESNSWGSLSLSLIPTLEIQNSRFSISGMVAVREGVYGWSDGSGELFSGRTILGMQGSYRLSRPWELFLMNSMSSSMGPFIPVNDPSLSALQQAFGSHGGISAGMSTGAIYNASPSISISPSVNWFYTQQSIDQSMVSVSALFHLI